MIRSSAGSYRDAQYLKSMTDIPHAHLPTEYGPALIYGFSQDNKEHCALVFGDVTRRENVLCRVHSSCIT